MLDEDELIPSDEARTNAWYISWADMTTLLLTYFIVLFTFSTISTTKFREATTSIQRAFHIPIPEVLPMRPDLEGDRQAREIQKRIDQEGLVGVFPQDYGDRIVVTMDSDIAFLLWGADLSPQGMRILERLLPVLQNAPGEIRIEGHTCDTPPALGSPYADNWELSTARAVRVVQALIALGIPPRKIAGAGYSDQRPLVPNDDESNRARNRRVEFVIEKNMIPADE
jgi:chemotaxis protein MotB